MEIKTIISYWPLIVGVLIPALVFLWAAIGKQLQGIAKARTAVTKPFPLDADETTFTAFMAALVYPAKGEKNKAWRANVGQRIEQRGGKLLDIRTNSGIEFMTVEYNDLFVIAFRGTSGLFDWVTNLVSTRRKAPLAGSAHSGFLTQAETSYFRLNLQQKIKQAKADGKKIVVTGHSQGAALAIEFAGIMEANLTPPNAVLAICAPRSANKQHAVAMANALQNRLIRVTFSRDIVCLVPPAFAGYRHIGPTKYFDMHGEYNSELTTMFRVSDLVGSIGRDFFQLPPLKNTFDYHSATKVVNLIAEHIYEFDLKSDQ